jgi:hypothetical protein
VIAVSQARKAHSDEIIDKRLRDCELAGAGNVDVMELIGLYDELARVERKWREKAAAPPRTGPRARPPANAAMINARFERLTRLTEAALRSSPAVPDPAQRQWLQRTAEALRQRTPLPTS